MRDLSVEQTKQPNAPGAAPAALSEEHKTVQETSRQIAGRLLTCAVLACIAVLFVHNVERWNPTAFFGRLHDDGIYFSTAKALADGQGYVLASFPGTPAQTKYPIVYPWLLSWIWKLHPAFPSNLIDAVRLTEFFGCWALLAAFFLLRKLPGIGHNVALVLTAVCAFQPFLVRFSGVIMSDVPFAALVLTALALADRAARPKAEAWLVIATGLAAGLSTGMRTIGVAAIGGIFVLALRRRAYRQAILLGIAAALVVGVESWPTMLHRIPVKPVPPDSPDSGWVYVLAYYTDYIGFNWRMGVPTFTALLEMVKLNLLLLLSSPGSTIAGLTGKWASTLTAILSVPIWLGIARQRKHEEWQPIFFVLFLYGCVVLVWPWPQPERFSLPFIPVFLAGLWLELRRLSGALRANLRPRVPLSQRLLAGTLTVALSSLLAWAAWDYLIRDPRDLQLASASQARALEQRTQVYAWIRQHTAAGDRIAAYRDAPMYLYTGRQGLRPIQFLPTSGYLSDTKSQAHDLAHIADASRHIGARYWLRTADDFDLEVGKEKIDARLAELDSVFPVLFQSQNGTAQVRDASCLIESTRADCKAVQRVLFPYAESR